MGKLVVGGGKGRRLFVVVVTVKSLELTRWVRKQKNYIIKMIFMTAMKK